jgi:hypothetical protein
MFAVSPPRIYLRPFRYLTVTNEGSPMGQLADQETYKPQVLRTLRTVMLAHRVAFSRTRNGTFL